MVAMSLLDAPPPGEFPGRAEAGSHLVALAQQPGEALFVPSGWFHTGELPICWLLLLPPLSAGCRTAMLERAQSLSTPRSSLNQPMCRPLTAVENLDDCVSINHNWFNGHNMCWVWALLRRERQQAEAAIEDCRQLCRSEPGGRSTWQVPVGCACCFTCCCHAHIPPEHRP